MSRFTPEQLSFAAATRAAIERARGGFLAELGLTLTACNSNTWMNPKFRLGGPCNPDPAIRRAVLDVVSPVLVG